MAESAAGLVGAFVELAHATARHAPYIIDGYYGPRSWAQVEARSVGDLAADAEALQERLTEVEDARRRAYLDGQVRALGVTLAVLAGRAVPFREEVQRLYDVRPEAVPESRLAELRGALRELLPGDGSLADRVERLAEAERVPEERTRRLVDMVLGRLRELTKARYPLPEEEQVELRLVRDKPWSGYNTYLGAFTSRVEINIDVPLRLHALPGLLAHEAYPGHHTEQTVRERSLVREQGRLEHTLLLLGSPSSTVSEGLAESALGAVLAHDALRAWLSEELVAAAGVQGDAALRMLEAGDVHDQLTRGAVTNAALMLFEQGAADGDVIAYLQEQALATREEAAHKLRFLRAPLSGSYVFTYAAGRALLERLFATGEMEMWFARLMAEPVTPSGIREWIEEAEGGSAGSAGAPAPTASRGPASTGPAPAGRSQPGAGRPAPAGERAAPAEGHAAPAGERAAPAEQHAAPADGHGASAGERAAPADEHAAPADRPAPPQPPAEAEPPAVFAERGPSPTGPSASADETPAEPPAPGGTASPASAARERDLSPLLADLELGLGGTLGVAARALSDAGRPLDRNAVSYRPDEPFPAASTIKAFILQTLLEHVAAGDAHLDEEVVLGSSDRVMGTGVLKALTPGRAYTLRDLATLMIIVSDNTATNMLIQRLGVQAVNAVASAHGWTSTSLVGLLQRPDLRAPSDERVSTTSAHDLVDYFGRLWAGELLGPELTALAQGIYRRQQFTEQLGRYLPFDPDRAEAGEAPFIASKNGFVPGVRNDAGVVEAGGRRYALAILTKDCPDLRVHPDNRGSIVVSKVSRLLYQRFVER